MAKAASRTWQDVELETLQALDIRVEYQALGVNINGHDPNADGWITCHAVGREDRTPSAAVNVQTGRYRDLGGQGLSLSLWDFAATFGKFSNWREAREEYARKAGVKLPSGRPAADPAEHLDFRPWNEALVALWCLKKPGVTPEAVRLAGGRLARYRGQYNVIAIPVFGAGGVDAEPVGWALYNTTGKELPVFQKGGAEPRWVKVKTTAGSQPGMMGLVGLARLADESAAVDHAWKTEGPSDMLALLSAIPPDLRDRHPVTCNANGSTENPKPAMLAPFAGRSACVIHDADEAGERGGSKWAAWLAGPAAEVRHVRLPYDVQPAHGKDLRDWICDGHTFEDLLRLAGEAKVISRPAGGTKLAVIEADDDPHRLARIYLDAAGRDPEFGLVLRYWRQEWWRWTQNRYVKLDAETIRGELTATIKAEFDRLNLEAQEAAEDGQEVKEAAKVTSGRVNNVLLALESLCVLGSDQVEEMPAWLDGRGGTVSKGCIALRNGILDLDALLAEKDQAEYLLPHTPAWFSSICLDYDFDPGADCPRWKQTLFSNLENDPERISLLQEWAGYLLTPDTSQQKFLILEGEGSNGKSVYCAGIEAMLGSANVSHIQLELFGQRFALTDTLHKLANIAADCGEMDKVAEGYLKSFTGGDRMYFDRKGVPGFSASPTARMMMATNNRPRFSDKSGGVWRRMMLVPFNREVLESERIVGMDKHEWWHASGELPGILCWAIAGLYRLRKAGRFTRPALCQEMLDEYRLEINPARSFLEETCEANSFGSTSAGDLYSAYKKWCSEFGYKPLAERQFGKEVHRKFPQCKKRRGGNKENRFWYYDGVILNQQF